MSIVDSIADYIILFKGINKARIYGFSMPGGAVQDTVVILGSPNSDFGSDHVYFTPQLATARYYAAYTKLRGSDETNVVVIAIAIRNEVLEGLTGDALQHLYWPDDEWKEYVRYNRSRRSTPSALRRFRRAILLIGSTSKKDNLAWRRLTGPQSVSEDYVLKINGQPAIHYAFDGSDEGQDFLKENIAPQPCISHFTKVDWNNWWSEYRDQGV